MADPQANDAATSSTKSGYDHLSPIRFTNLLRQLDRAASADSQPNKKRKIGEVASGSATTSSTAVRQRIVDWAKTKGSAELERRSLLGSSDAGKQAASAYSPFSRPRLLERIATYHLSSYNIRLPSATTIVKQSGKASSPQEEEHFSKSVQALIRWLEPVGPALFGWTHLAPYETTTTTRQPTTTIKGEKNKLYCKTCEATYTVSVAATEAQTTLASLVANVRSLHNEHKQWCAWRKRRCDVNLYHVGGGDTDGEKGPFIGHLSRAKAREVFSSTVLAVQTALSDTTNTATVQRPNNLTEDQLSKLTAFISPETDTPTPPTLESATLLTLYGWSLTNTKPTLLFTCHYCARKVSLSSSSPTSTRTRTINPEHEHRQFCPWIQGERLCDLSVEFLQSDDEEEVLNKNGENTTTTPAWQVSLHTLLPPHRSASPELQRENAQSFSELKESQVARLLSGWFGAR